MFRFEQLDVAHLIAILLTPTKWFNVAAENHLPDAGKMVSKED